jgi:hypothetical protein
MLFLGQQKTLHRILNSSDPRVPFGPIGNCIYCENETDLAKLTLEHIIPSGIAGNLELEKSSCFACAKITGRNEQICLRQLFDTPRAVHGLRKRKHKDASQTGQYLFIKGGKKGGKFDESAGEKREMEFSKGPPNIIPGLFTRSLPGILLGLPATAKIPGVFHGNVDFQSLHSAHVKEGGKPNIDEVAVQFKFDVGRLGQMIAKIAHSYAVSQLGLGTFTPFFQKYIQQRDGALFNTHYMGSMEMDVEPCIHKISLHLFPVDQAKYWLVRLQPFAWRSRLVYFAVVGLAK